MAGFVKVAFTSSVRAPYGPAMRERIIAEIRRLAEANNGQPPGVLSFERETAIRRSQWYGIYWARWGDALIEAGFAPNDKTVRTDTDHLLRKVAEAYRHYGRVATDGELALYRQRDPEVPWRQTIGSHYPSKAHLIVAVKAWAATHDGYADVAAMLPDNPVVKGARPPKAKDGSVYLIQSGPNYKIGRSDELERRVKEIRIALPDAATLVHTITTDDPPGIEAYWHRRFAKKRANGEWFKLTPADVLAFKRRKFQ